MNRQPACATRCACAAVVLIVLGGFAGADVLAMPAALRIINGFVESGGVLAAPAAGEPRLATQETLPAGYYQFTAEYKTEGFDPLGKFAMDAKQPDRTSISSYEWAVAQPAWAPLVLYFRVTEAAPVQFRLGNWTRANADARVLLRTPSVRPFAFIAMSGGTNWLVDGAFDGGQPGSIPPNWYWNSDAGKIDQQALAPNPSYRSGKHILRLRGDATKIRELRYRSLPLPDNGELTFSVWARADQPATLTMHIIQDGWGKRAERGHALTTAWQKYEVVWPVPTTREKAWFFLRLDASSNAVPIEIADAQLVWRAAGPVAGIDPFAAARQRGWQGTPGRNLLLNPDFELGGDGFFYDFSWPKQYAQYASIRQARPIRLLAGQGVDGGTCALVQGTSLRPYCFPVTVGQTYTLSADLRAPAGQVAAECRVWAFDSEWKGALASRVDKIPGDAWKHYSWTFTWKNDNLQKRGYVRFDSPGVLVDRIQVVEGTGAEYDPPPVMLGLVCDRWPYFVRGRDAAQALLKVVPGVHSSGTAAVKVVARDAWGHEAWTRTLDAPLDKETLLPISLPTDRLGVFHVDLTATITNTVAGIGIGRYAILDPPALQPAVAGKPRLAGICQESFNFPVWLCEDHARIQTDLGIRFNRFFAAIPPDLPDPLPPEWAADLKAKCHPFREAGIDVMPCLDVIPDSAAKGAQNLEMPRPQDLEAFGSHLHAYVAALKDEVTYFEIFNEPNLWRMPSGPNAGKRTMFPAKYLEFQKVAYQTIKAIDPKLRVVCNALNNVDFDWINDWMKGGAGRYMDIFSFHPYSVTDFYDQGLQLEKTMHGFGFEGPLLASEKYFGANLFYDRAGYEETRRGYYLPYDGELKTAGRSIQYFISSAAVGVPACFFNPGGTLSSRGPGQALFLYDFFGAYSAAIRFMVGAGRAERVEMGVSATALLFPAAPEGPLVALWTPLLNAEGTLKLSGDFAAFDIMGNRFAAADVAHGVRVATDPVYLRFKPGTSSATIRAALAGADLVGMGAPIRVDASITGPRRFSALVTSQRSKTLDGQVRVLSLPPGWSVAATAKPFRGLSAGATTRVDFDLASGSVENMGEYPVSIVAECGEEFARQDVVLRPLFAKPIGAVKTDGDLGEWKDAEWTDLGENNLSRNFNPALAHTGAADLSARMAVGWRPDALALAVVVTDDRLQAAESPTLGWQGDSVQLYLDPLHDATAADPHAADNIEYLLSLIDGTSYAWLVKGAEGNFRGEANKVDGFNDVDAQVKVVRRGTETIYELVLPRKPCLPGLELRDGGAFGFSLLINDNDGAGRKVGLTLSPKGTEPYGAPHLYRDLVLLGQ